MSIEIRIEGAEEFERALKKIEKDFPQEIVKKLDEKATELEESIKSEMEWKCIIDTGKLYNSFKHYPPEKHFGKYSVSVDSQVRYAHLIEEGHKMLGHLPKKRYIRDVDGYNMVQDSVDKMNVNYQQDIEKWVYEVMIKRMG